MKTSKTHTQFNFTALVITLFVLLIDFSTAGAYLKSSDLSPKLEKTGGRRLKTIKASKKITTPTYTFNVSSDHSGYTYFNVSVNGASISGTEAITTGSPVTVYDYNPVAQGSTVVVQITGGYMPTSSVLEGPFPVIWGTISGSTITFTNVPLNNGYDECGLLLN